jgi:hypothetical protein
MYKPDDIQTRIDILIMAIAKYEHIFYRNKDKNENLDYMLNNLELDKIELNCMKHNYPEYFI